MHSFAAPRQDAMHSSYEARIDPTLGRAGGALEAPAAPPCHIVHHTPPPRWEPCAFAPEHETNVHVWTIRLHADFHPAEHLTCLDAEERERCRRFVFPQHRARYLQSHLALRQVLAYCGGVSPEKVVFLSGSLGRPELAAPLDHLTFNLSHTDQWAMIAVMDARWGAIGIDIESLHDSAVRADELRNSVLTPEENAALDHHSDQERGIAFTTAWTRKEAVLKATGWGLRIPPDTVSVGLSPEAAQVSLPGPLGALPPLAVYPLPAPARHVASLAMQLPMESSSRHVRVPKAIPNELMIHAQT